MQAGAYWEGFGAITPSFKNFTTPVAPRPQEPNSLVTPLSFTLPLKASQSDPLSTHFSAFLGL